MRAGNSRVETLGRGCDGVAHGGTAVRKGSSSCRLCGRRQCLGGGTGTTASHSVRQLEQPHPPPGGEEGLRQTGRDAACAESRGDCQCDRSRAHRDCGRRSSRRADAIGRLRPRARREREELRQLDVQGLRSRHWASGSSVSSVELLAESVPPQLPSRACARQWSSPHQAVGRPPGAARNTLQGACVTRRMCSQLRRAAYSTGRVYRRGWMCYGRLAACVHQNAKDENALHMHMTPQCRPADDTDDTAVSCAHAWCQRADTAHATTKSWRVWCPRFCVMSCVSCARRRLVFPVGRTRTSALPTLSGSDGGLFVVSSFPAEGLRHLLLHFLPAH